MDLIIEDGTIVENANSYATLQEIDAYLDGRGRTDWFEISIDRRKAAVILATDYLNTQFTWRGERYDRDQPNALPTTYFDTIPLAVKQAQALLAYEGRSVDLTKSIDGPSVVKERKKLDGVGEKEVEYGDSPLNGRSFPLISAMLARFTTSSSGGGIQSARRLLG